MTEPENFLASALTPVEKAEAADPSVGAGTPDAAPWETVEIPWLRREPIVAMAILLVLVQLAGALATLAANASPTVAVFLVGAAGLVTVAAGIVRRHVTPTALPRLDTDTPLVVDSDPRLGRPSQLP